MDYRTHELKEIRENVVTQNVKLVSAVYFLKDQRNTASQLFRSVVQVATVLFQLHSTDSRQPCKVVLSRIQYYCMLSGDSDGGRLLPLILLISNDIYRPILDPSPT